MIDKDFPIRLAKLRIGKGVSARDMSLSIGQNAGYINSIETGRSLPSMSGFFYICEYLDITPKEFFDYESENPRELNTLMEKLKLLDSRQMDAISALVDCLIR